MQIPRAFKELLELGRWRYKVYYGGRGSGKSHTIARALLALAMERPLRIVCAREVQTSIADSVHRLFSDLIAEYGLGAHFVVQKEGVIGSNGSMFIFKGLKHNVSGIKSLEGADIVWVEEAENVADSSWEVLIPTVRKQGSEIWVSFNTRSTSDPTYRRFVTQDDPAILCRKVSFLDNPFFPEVLDKERVRLRESDMEAYLHVWEGEPDTRRTGFIFAKQMHEAKSDGRVTRVPYDPCSEVFSAWDLGFGDHTSIWWAQFVGRELRVIDYYENTGEQLDHYVKVYKSKPYNYQNQSVYLPHDGGHGNIRGLSVSRQLSAMGLRNHVLEREGDIAPGIDLVRQTLSYMVIDGEKCEDGLHALEHYKYQWDEGRQIFKDKPYHDWSSNAADALRYLCRAAERIKRNPIGKRPDDPFRIRSGGSSWMGA